MTPPQGVNGGRTNTVRIADTRAFGLCSAPKWYISTGGLRSRRFHEPLVRPLHLAFASRELTCGAGSQREQSADESGECEFSASVPYDILGFGAAALTHRDPPADGTARAGPAVTRAPRNAFPARPLHLEFAPGECARGPGSQREQSADESGECKFSTSVPYDILGLRAFAVTLAARAPRLAPVRLIPGLRLRVLRPRPAWM